MSFHPDADASAPATHPITLGSGCFSCTEAVYERVKGVLAVESGYCNGPVKNPTCEQVCGGDTGHAEVVRVKFDTAKITLRERLEILFVIHDPTTLNRQGNDSGTQDRSGIYFRGADQQALASEVMAEVNAHHGGRAVTELLPGQNYSRAEACHQHYFAIHPNHGYCAMDMAPQVEKFRKTFASKVKPA